MRSPAARSGPQALSPRETRRLLIVEDDRATYTALRSLFVRRGWEVVVATNLAEALESLSARPSAVILDLMLPDGDGAVLLERMRQLGLDARVVVTTGLNDPVRLDAVKGFSPALLMHKPIDLLALYRSLDDVQ